MALLTSRGRADRLRELAGPVRAVLPAVVVGVLLAVLIPLGLGSLLGAAAALGVVLMMLLLATAGIERSAVTLLTLGFVFAPMNNVKPVAAISFVTMSDVFLLVGVMTLFPVLVSRGIGRQAPFLIGVAGLVVVGLLSSAAAEVPAASLNVLVRLLVGAMFLPLVFMAWRPGRGVMTLLAVAYLAGNGISVADGLITRTVSVEGRYIGLTEHPNILGLTSLLAISLVPFLLAEVPRRFRWTMLVAGAVSAYGIWMSGSRAALLGAVAMILIYLVLSRSIEHALLLFGASIVPMYLVGRALTSSDVGSNALDRLRGGGSASLSDIDRENIARTAIDKFVDHPILGTGFADASLAHNIYLQIAAAGGVLGLAFYLLVLGATVRQPLLLQQPLRLLALPAMAYALVGPLTPLLWDRYIWCALALPFLVAAPDRDDSARDADPPPVVA